MTRLNAAGLAERDKRGPDIHGRIELTEKRHIYRHQLEYRGHGICAIYSYGRAGDHDKLVREARNVMRSRMHVSDATSSGGCSNWPQDEFRHLPRWEDHTEETQTIFCLYPVGGKAPAPRQVPPGGADWALNIVVDRGTGYLADGDNTLFYEGPDLDRDEWHELADRLADGDELVEFAVNPLAQGRFWFLREMPRRDEWPLAWSARNGWV